ncbi:MAG: hypothetical protein COB77_06405 [Gammaproteobacteria bacterium]|nr:MAG: hypothetical protein COB77_06405 [Gammaproteobacteria bacterium]
MVVSSGFNSALSGVHKGFESLQENARQIANASAGGLNAKDALLESVVGLKSSVLQINASMQMVKTLDDVLGTLIDIND